MVNYLFTAFILMLNIACGDQTGFSSNVGSKKGSEDQVAAELENSQFEQYTPVAQAVEKTTPVVAKSPNPILNPTPKKVSSYWYSDDYKCLTAKPSEEVILISRTGNRITAVKTIGTNCVKKGQVTWEANIDPTTNEGAGFLHTNLPVLNIKNQIPIKVKMRANKIYVSGGKYNLEFDLKQGS